MFGFLKNNLKKMYEGLTKKIGPLFSQPVDEQALKELERILISADVGVTTSRSIIAALTDKVRAGTITSGSDLKTALSEHLVNLLPSPAHTSSSILLLVGVNGSGKTTVAGKLAHRYIKEGKKVLLVAADTFRAAAPEQLQHWAKEIGTDIVIGKPQQDAAAVIFEGCERFKQGNYDLLIIDTAGRLQTKIPLMKELEKVRRIITKYLPNHAIETLLVVDAMLGQNSLEQAKVFHEATPLSGIILTKMDGTAKGGIVFAITEQLHIPIQYLSFGEQLEALAPFEPQAYVTSLLEL